MKKGFTLAEAILTLGIIGVIAATTIPTMIHETNKKRTIEQLKKSAATLNQAIYNATITNGELNTWTWQTGDGIANIMQNIITPRLNVGYICAGNPNKSKYCSYPVIKIDGSEQDISEIFNARTTVLLADSSLIAFTDANTFLSDGSGGGGSTGDGSGGDIPTGSSCEWGADPKTLCGIFMVDVNGNKKPNAVGKDVFYYGVYLSGSILPYGAVEEGNDEGFIEKHCSVGSSGKTCAAKITENGWDVCYTTCSNGVGAYPVRF